MHHVMYYWCIEKEHTMRTTINLDEQLIADAQRMTGIQERTALIHEGLRVLIARESSRRLARLGGSDPRAKAPRRRRVS
jgi:Arc/MetJ family transcription regulator